MHKRSLGRGGHEGSARVVSRDLLGNSALSTGERCLCGGHRFETHRADGSCPRQQGAPEVGCLPPAEANWSPRDAGETGVPSESGYGVLPAADPGKGAVGPTDGQSETVLDPLLGPRETNSRSTGGEGAAAHTHPGGGGSRWVSFQRPGARVSTTPPAPGLPPPGRWGPGARAPGSLLVEGGGGGDGAPPAPRPGWGRRKLGLGAPACRREGL